MTQPDEPGQCTDETGERVASQAETLASRVAIVQAPMASFGRSWPVPTAAAPQPVPAQVIQTSIIEHQRARLPTAAELTDHAIFATMLDVMRQAEVMMRQAWARPCCAGCGRPAATSTVANGHAYHPACASCALERAFGDR